MASYLLAEAECSFSIAVVDVILLNGVALVFCALCALRQGEEGGSLENYLGRGNIIGKYIALES